MTMTTSKPNWKKMLVQGLFGAVCGALAMIALLRVGLAYSLDRNGGALALAGVGMIYLLMGLIVGLGTVLPGVGAKLLNVADREELRDERPMLVGSAAACSALGLAQLALAFSGPGGPVSPGIALTALAGSLLLSVAISIAQWRLYDELIKRVSWEGSAAALLLLNPILIGWAALAHLGLGPQLNPLGVVALVTGLSLFGTFVAAGLRGMLNPA